MIGRLYMAWCALFVAAPILVVGAASLNGGRTMRFPPEAPTLARYAEFFVGDPVWTASLRTSILIALASAAIATLLAWPLAYWVWKRSDRLSGILSSLIAMPFILPPIVFGVGLGFLWSFTGGLGHLWAGILSHAALFAALPLATISIGLRSIDASHLDAARTMGATDAIALRTVILPQTLPYTLSGFFFAMVLSFNEFIVIFFVSASGYSTVTLQIFNSLRNGFTPTMAVAAVLFIVVSGAVFALIGRFSDLPRMMGADPARNA